MNRRTFLLGGLGLVGMAAGGGVLFTQQEKFGRLPSGARLMRMQASPHYVNGRFECLEPVEILSDKSENRVLMTIKFFMQDKSA
ncbi:MAG: MBL fold metallo-hydrolase, partial [Schwartzia sp.]|nr:MBL fold metallo-hydrolase [Schwartzia sp. (in: firmicutes)]